MKKLFLLSIVLLLSACGAGVSNASGASSGSGIEGRYVHKGSPASIELKSNGMASLRIESTGISQDDSHYEVIGDQIKYGGINQFTIMKDGLMLNDTGEIYSKK